MTDIRWTVSDSTELKVSLMLRLDLQVKTHEKTYDIMPRQALERMIPIQSISV